MYALGHSASSHFVRTAASKGLTLPSTPGGGVAAPGKGLASTATYGAVAAQSAAVRASARAMLGGRALGNMRLDSAAKNPTLDAKSKALMWEWMQSLAFRRGITDVSRLDGARRDGITTMAYDALTSFLSDVYTIEHSDLPAWDGKILKIDRNSVDPAAEKYTWYDVDMVGVARVGNTYSTMDIPMVAGGVMQPNEGSIVPALVGMETNFMDDRRAALARSNGKPNIDDARMKAEACQRALAEFANVLWLYGDPILGINGFHNHPGVASITLTGAAWTGKTAAQIAADLVNIFNSQRNASQGGLGDMSRLRVLLPPTAYQFAMNLVMGASADKSVVKFFSENNNIKPDQIQQIDVFASANSAIYEGGPLGLTRDTGAVIYEKGDRWDPVFMLPQDIEMPAPPRQNGLSETTFYHMRVGGMKVADSRRIKYIEGL